MIRSYLSIAYRNLLNKSSFVLINVGGLAVGIAVGLLIMLWIFDELSYDRFHQHSDRIYRIVFHGEISGNAFSQPRTPHPMPLALSADFAEVESGVSISPIWSSGLSRARFKVEYQDQVFEETGILTVDTTFFKVFTFKVLQGDPLQCLHTVGGIVLTESMARKYFAQADPLGKFLRINGDADVLVTAVVEDVPKQSHFSFDFLIGYPTMKFLNRQDNQGELADYYTWRDHGHYNYILLKAGADPQELQARIKPWAMNYLPAQSAEFNFNYELQPVTKIHLYSNLIWELGSNGNIQYIYVFSLVAILIIVVACINFMNMSITRNTFRLKEVGVRKAIGSTQSQLIQQFLLESVLTTLIAFAIAGFLLELLMPFFRNLTGKSPELKMFLEPGYLAVLFLIIVIITLISGGYPAFYLASHSPQFALKNKGKSSAGIKLRKALVIFQFAVSFFLIASTLIIFHQLRFLQKAPTGYDRQSVIMIPLRDNDVKFKFHVLKNSIAQLNGILKVAGTSNIPGGNFNLNGIKGEGDREELVSSEMWCDTDFLDLLDIQLKEGRNFSPLSAADSFGSFIINETAFKSLQWNPEGDQKIMTWYGDSPGTIKGKVIGIVKDFNFHSLHHKVEPLVIQLGNPYNYNYLLVKVLSGTEHASIEAIGQAWNSILPDYEFHYSFLDLEYENLYQQEERMGVVFTFFAIFTILIAALGLFGLSGFLITQRAREIAIRRILGASLSEITTLISWNYLHWILLAIPLSAPLTYFYLNDWLNNFNYHSDLGWGYFLLAAAQVFLVALIPLLQNTLKISRINSIEALKQE
jgi:putative ABC transport system permease protein